MPHAGQPSKPWSRKWLARVALIVGCGVAMAFGFWCAPTAQPEAAGTDAPASLPILAPADGAPRTDAPLLPSEQGASASPRDDLEVELTRFERMSEEAADVPASRALPPLRLDARCGEERFSALTGSTWVTADHTFGWWQGRALAVFRQLPAGECTFTHDEAGWAFRSQVIVDGSRRAALNVEREAVLVVEIEDAQGLPVAASLRVTGPGLLATAHARVPAAIRADDAQGDADSVALEVPSGHLEFTGLRRGHHLLSVTAQGCEVFRGVELVAGQVRTVRLVMGAPAALQVRLEGVSHDAEGPPIAVWLTFENSEEPARLLFENSEEADRVLQGPGGPTFLFPRLPAGEVRLVVRRGQQDLLSRSSAIALGPGEQKQHTLRLGPAIVDAEVEGGRDPERVFLDCSDEQGALGVAQDTVDGRARFQVPRGMSCRAGLLFRTHDDVEAAVPGVVRLRVPEGVPMVWERRTLESY